MKIYKAYLEKGIEELGDLDMELVSKLLEESESTEQENSFSLGICRSDQDFIEVSFVGKNHYLLWSDRLFKVGSFWQRLNQRGRIKKIVTGRDEVLKNIDFYVNKTREEFEAKCT